MSLGAPFLARPDAFPARATGEPWGEARVTLHCVGLRFAFAGLAPHQARALRDHLGPFVLEGQEEDGETMVSHLFRVPEDTFHHPPTRDWELWMDFAYGAETVTAASLRMRSWLGWTPQLHGAVWTCVAEGPELLGILENHLRVLVAYRLLAAGGALLHSSGVVDDGGAFLFLGPSGAGKTTVAALGRDANLQVLSDDMNAALPARTGPALVCRVPFAGDPTLSSPGVGPAHRFPLRGLVRLRQGATNRLHPLGPSTALATLTACSPFVNRDPFRQALLLENLAALLQDTPALDLEFPRHGGFWPLLRETTLEMS